MPKDESGEPVPTVPPRIVAATAPTEVVSTSGEPRWKSLPSGKLLYVENTETPWVRDLETQQMYLLLSGRWFRAGSADGPWSFVRADQLPPSFKEIPPGSDLGGVRTSVAGTEEADDAMLDAAIPQTTAIKRDEAKFESQYDGSPKFEPIPGTSVSYAVNTGSQILQVGNRYYAADNGVWFMSGSATGPWTVADQVPEEEIRKIPPSAPVYNVTQLHVYQSTPQVVYVGYTPGYMWSYPYYGVPVYGTGYYYPPYYGAYYYPRPPTWGFHVGYNPWTGWNVGMGYSNGFYSFGVGWSSGWGGWGPGYRRYGCCGGYGGYGGGYHHGPTFVNNGNINIGNRYNRTRNGTGNARNVGRDNVYNRPENRVRNANRASAASNVTRARPSTGKANNVFADKDGNVARKTKDGWQARGKNGWEKPEAADVRQKVDRADLDKKRTGAGQGSAAEARQKVDRADLDQRGAGGANAGQARQRLDSADLNRSAAARQRGASREVSRPPSTRSRPSSAPSRPSSAPSSRPSGGGRPQPRHK